ncbi:hypothetical protein PLESTF_001541500, partial [Pleodorina starrii]
QYQQQPQASSPFRAAQQLRRPRGWGGTKCGRHLRRRHLHLAAAAICAVVHRRRRSHLHLAAAAICASPRRRRSSLHSSADRHLHLAVMHCPCLQRLRTEIHQHLPRRQVTSPPPRTRPNTNIFTHV